jgi:DinB superfamily
MPLDFSEIILSIEEREHDRLIAMKEQDVSTALSPGKWSRKEILGHLIDSASNNHQRFVRAQISEGPDFPPYSQVEWVDTQNYADESWRLLVDLWSSYNLHLAHVIAGIPPDKLKVACKVGDKAPVTLEELIADYVRHMEHHLKQLNGSES